MTSFEAGDIVWIDLDPVKGTEQGGRRPGIVLTGSEFNSRDQRSIICPITRNLSPWPTKVILPDHLQTKGAVLADQPRTVHRLERGFRLIEKAPEDILNAVREILGELLQIANR
ncbi:type II toxin-antitoxin system PemK/MazF family toxin [Mesorhizobium sp. SB112]|uniref:type II toxin-antitoxin system PemK/MazF family toxin n=1 Tax=Mesorhizobium sp. SB112 TaxID=3151853 RepID=UPI003264DA91